MSGSRTSMFKRLPLRFTDPAFRPTINDFCFSNSNLTEVSRLDCQPDRARPMRSGLQLDCCTGRACTETTRNRLGIICGPQYGRKDRRKYGTSQSDHRMALRYRAERLHSTERGEASLIAKPATNPYPRGRHGRCTGPSKPFGFTEGECERSSRKDRYHSSARRKRDEADLPEQF